MTDMENTAGAVGIDDKVHALLCDLQAKGAREYPGAGCVGRHWKSWMSHVPSDALDAWIRADGKARPDTPSPDLMKVQGTILMSPTKGHGAWAPDRVLLLDGDTVVRALPAKHQLVTDAWRILTMPRLVYMPEKDRLMLLVRRELPYRQYESDTLIMLSDNQGYTWSAPVIVPRGICNVGYLGNGKLRIGGGRSGSSGFELLDWRSDDYGESWSAKSVPEITTDDGFWQWGDCLVDMDKDGSVERVLAPGYTAKKGWPSCCCMLRVSYDGGDTWGEEIIPPSWNGESGVGVSEVSLCRAANGIIVAGCRTARKKFKGKIDFYSGLGVSVSKDNGQSWSKINFLYEYGRHHSSIVLMPDGRMVMAYVNRLGGLDEKRRVLDSDGVPQWSVEAVISNDNGETWDTAHRYILAMWSGMASVQDTTTVLLSDGSLLTGFGGTYRSEQDCEIRGPAIDVGLVRWHPDYV